MAILFRVSILFFFAGVLNKRYGRVLSDNLVIISAFFVAKRFWVRSFGLIDFLYTQHSLLLGFTYSIFLARLVVVREVLSVKVALLVVLLQTSIQLFSNVVLGNFRSSLIFSGVLSGLFLSSGVSLASNEG